MALMLLAVSSPAAAHTFWPSLLTIQETEPGTAMVDFKIANTNRGVLPLTLTLPDNCVGERLDAPKHYVPEAKFRLQRFRVTCPGDDLVGRAFEIGGLSATGADVMVNYEASDGRRVSTPLTATRPVFEVPARVGLSGVLSSHAELGAEHVLGGADHLLFVLALVLILRHRPKRLVVAVTCFTVAHAVTVTLAVLGVLVVHPAPVEVVIALSIWLLAVELARGDAARQAGSNFFLALVFACGLLHGLGFASALTTAGLPDELLGPALLAFNLGIEAGQLAFALVVYSMVALSARLQSPPAMRAATTGAVPYGIGVIAVFWTLERLQSMLF